MTKSDEVRKINRLEKEVKYNEKLLSQIGELVDEGVECTSLRHAKQIFVQIGESLGMNMSETKDELRDDDYIEEEEEDEE